MAKNSAIVQPSRPLDTFLSIALCRRPLMTVFVECRDCDDLPIDEPDVRQEHVRSPVVGPSFDGNGGADRVRLTVRGVSCQSALAVGTGGPVHAGEYGR